MNWCRISPLPDTPSPECCRARLGFIQLRRRNFPAVPFPGAAESAGISLYFISTIVPVAIRKAQAFLLSKSKGKIDM
jgi:hypothetical protein